MEKLTQWGIYLIVVMTKFSIFYWLLQNLELKLALAIALLLFTAHTMYEGYKLEEGKKIFKRNFELSALIFASFNFVSIMIMYYFINKFEGINSFYMYFGLCVLTNLALNGMRKLNKGE